MPAAQCDDEGTDSPTVILEAGFGGNANDWSEVQGPLGRATRTCAYDRAGLGDSLPIPGVHDAADEIADLSRLRPAPIATRRPGPRTTGLGSRVVCCPAQAIVKTDNSISAKAQEAALTGWRARPPKRGR